ncbi:MAG TPA: protein kinase [Thermoanaerobaculia bacterium]|jgi:serine/threonine-protein kinase
MELASGSRIGPYEIVEPIGAGGMSEVYRARDHRLERDVAIKVLQGGLSARPAAITRFEKEAKAVAALSHPNIVAIYDVGVEGGRSYLVMELLHGETLRNVMDAGLSWRRAAKIAATVAEALRAAHARGIVHRDLKPDNIIVTHDGVVKVLDFGLARVVDERLSETSDTLTAPGTVMGTAGYMSPEQVRGEPVGVASDLFSLGCILHEMLSGVRPFGRGSPAETMASILRDQPADLRMLRRDVPEPLIRVVERCLEKEPQDRFQSASDLAFALAAAVDGSDSAARAAAAPRKPSRASMALLAVLLVALVAAIFAARRATTTQQRPGARSLAVLPFANSNADPALNYLAEGLTEGIINNLSPVAGFKVLSRNAVFSYRRGAEDPREIGRDLGVDAIVSGRVSQHGQALVVSVELVDARDGRQIWGERYDRPLAEMPQIERELSRQISEKLQMRLTGEHQSRMNRRASVDPEAYRLYLRGRHEWNKRTPEGLENGIELFRRSIEVDPAFAPAHAGIADTYLLLGGTYEILPPREAMPLARQAALRALELDPALAEAHASLGLIAHEFEWDWPRAEQSFRRAIELNPNYGPAHQWYGSALIYRGRFDEGLAQLKRAEELDPLSLVTRSDLAQAYWISGQYDTSIAHARKLTEQAPRFWLGYWFLGLAHIGKNDLAGATAALEDAVRLGGSPAAVGTLAWVHARAGRRDAALRLLSQLRELSRKRYVSPAAFVTIYLGLNDLDAAFEELDRAVEERSTLLTAMNVVPLAEPLRRDPRYAEYARRVGL